MQKILAKELGRGNIRLSTRLWGILTTHKFDMGNIGLSLPSSLLPASEGRLTLLHSTVSF